MAIGTASTTAFRRELAAEILVSQFNSNREMSLNEIENLTQASVDIANEVTQLLRVLENSEV